jgi:Rha family phage regulatory protein
MNGLINMNNGNPIVSSKDIADKFGKVHRTVVRAINSLDCSDEFREHHYTQSSYVSEQNKKLPCYNMTRDGFTFLCMGFTGPESAKWKESYIAAFNAMEKVLTEAPSTMMSLNAIVSAIEHSKDAASIHGRELAKYKVVKKEQEEEFKIALDQAQLALGFKEVK